MMRALFYLSSAAFWLLILAIANLGDAPVAPIASVAPPAAPTQVAVRRITLTEVAQHASADSCWMAIHGQVYDLTAYLPEHPTQPSVILPWCGQDASEAYQTKNKGRAHSPRADRLLADYPIGVLD
jgi:cytochrome b involved in lipid metabolism